MAPFDQLEPDRRLQTILRESRLDATLPPRFQQEVWRRIERAETVSPSWVDRVAGWLLRPRIIAAGCTAILVLSGFAGAMNASMNARESAKIRYLAAVAPLAVQ